MSVYAILMGQHQHAAYDTQQEAIDEILRFTEGYAYQIAGMALIRFGEDPSDNELIAKEQDLVQLVLGLREVSMTGSKSIKGSIDIKGSKTVPIPTITLRSGQTIPDPTFKPVDWREIPTPRNVGGTEQQIWAVKEERERLLNALPILSRHQDADGLAFVYLADLEALILDEDPA